MRNEEFAPSWSAPVLSNFLMRLFQRLLMMLDAPRNLSSLRNGPPLKARGMCGAMTDLSRTRGNGQTAHETIGEDQDQWPLTKLEGPLRPRKNVASSMRRVTTTMIEYLDYSTWYCHTRRRCRRTPTVNQNAGSKTSYSCQLILDACHLSRMPNSEGSRMRAAVDCTAGQR